MDSLPLPALQIMPVGQPTWFTRGLPGQYANMWQKIRSMWVHAYNHYDSFHIAGDIDYIVFENLCAFVDNPQVLSLENGHLDDFARDPRYSENAKKWLSASGNPTDENDGILGRTLYFGVPYMFRNTFPCGGPDYTLVRAALEVLGMLKLDSLMTNAACALEDLFVGSMFSE